ncbi:MAG: prephenate dehydratase [Firmicutes bacterium]|nr:prephenate dehydratase [Bacillota bacterium]MCM1401118.1 prephenate dehydratase [Bacteroides sp.]MCM1477059.1 prephenate dehydratase [Bacteroides sp.]
MKRTVTIQGVAGCYHDAAARHYFALHHPEVEVDTLPCNTFPQMMDKLDSDPQLVGIMAIENTIAGALLQNHELLRKSSLTIVGEYKMRISHVLAALPGETLESITEVNSHPMALMQCEQFLNHFPGKKIIESFDTAGSARDIAQNNLRGHAAICGKYAAELYGLNILAESIETNKRNFTRFLILADPLSAPELKPSECSLDKASIVFTLPHTKGALSKVLTILSFYDINLSKIQSMPIIGREWEYRFYVDLTFNSYARYIQAIDAVRPLISDFKTLGEYTQSTNEY